MHTKHKFLKKTKNPSGVFSSLGQPGHLSPPPLLCRLVILTDLPQRHLLTKDNDDAPWSAAGCCNCLSVASKVPSPTLLSFNTPPLVSVTCCPGLAELPTLMLSNGGRRATTWFWLVGHIHPGDLGDPGDYQLRI